MTFPRYPLATYAVYVSQLAPLMLYPISNICTRTNFQNDNSFLQIRQFSIHNEFVTRYVAIVILAFNCTVWSNIAKIYIRRNGNRTNISLVITDKIVILFVCDTITRTSLICLHVIVSIVISPVHLSRINMMETASKPLVVWYKLTSILVQTYCCLRELTLVCSNFNFHSHTLWD